VYVRQLSRASFIAVRDVIPLDSIIPYSALPPLAAC